MTGLGVGEALAITSLVPPALHAIRILIDDIRGIRDAPSSIKRIVSELETVEGVIATLDKSVKDERNMTDDFKELVSSKQIEQAVIACGKSCQSFREQLQKWLKHSTETEVHWWDRAKVGFLGANKVQALITELNTCKATINLSLNCATFLAAGAQHQANKELLKLKEDEVREEGALVLSTASQELSQLAQISLDDDDDAEDIDMESLKDLKKDIKQGKASVQEYKELLATVLVRYECQRTGVKVKNVKIQGSNAVLGVQNLEGKEGEVIVDIEDVLADGGSTVMIGAQNKVDFTGFWTKSAQDKSHST